MNWRSDGYIVREKATKLSRGRSKGPAAAVGVGTPLWVRSRGSSVVNLGADGLSGGPQDCGLLEHQVGAQPVDKSVGHSVRGERAVFSEQLAAAGISIKGRAHPVNHVCHAVEGWQAS